MYQKITQIDLILYYYNETQLTESVLIQKGIDSDPEVRNCFELIKHSDRMLNELLERPSRHCLEELLNYSRSLIAEKE